MAVRRSVLWTLVVGWLLLGLAWAIANPPFAAPDEADHYLRAVGIGEGVLVGSPAPRARIGADPAEIRFTKSTQRSVPVPAALDPTPYDCYIGNPRVSAACLSRPARRGPRIDRVTSVGTYPPLALLAPAMVVGTASTPLQADRLGRLASLALALALLVTAALVLFESAGGVLSVVGLLAACTPTAIFLAASMNPSGLSVAAAIATTASLLRLGRGSPVPRGVWAAFGLSGAALALSHPTGLAWLLLLIGGFVAMTGIARTRELLRRCVREALPWLIVLSMGALAALTWQMLYGPSTPIATRAIWMSLQRVPGQYWHALQDVVAGFGYLEFRLPLFVYLAWFAFVAALASAAFRVGARRERRSLVTAGAAMLVLPAAIWMVVGRATGIGINGREYMPLLVVFPMLAGELAYRNRASLSHRALNTIVALAAAAGAIQFIAWYVNARRSATGIGGSLLFEGQARWSPPFGWWPWIAVTALGALALIAACAIGRGEPRAGGVTFAPTYREQLTGAGRN